MSDIFDLLDESLDQLADLEKFEPVHVGSHIMEMKFEEKEIGDMPAVTLTLSLVETLELTNKTLEPQEPGKKANITFFLKYKDKNTGEVLPNKVGQGQLKEVLRVVSENFGGATIREMMTNANGGQAAFTLKQRKDKNDPDNVYNTIKAVQNI